MPHSHVSRHHQCGHMRLSTSPRTDLASAIVASTIPHTRRISCSTRPTPEIAVAALCSTSRAHFYATNKPKGDGDHRSPREVERAQAAAIPREYATLGARLVTVEEPPGNLLAWRTEDAVSESALPAANCKLASTSSCECVSCLAALGEDIFVPNTKFPHRKSSKLQNFVDEPSRCSA